MRLNPCQPVDRWPRGRPRLLLITPPSSYRLAPYIAAAQRQGIDLLVASEGEHSLISEVAEGLHLRFRDPPSALARIRKAAQTHPFTGVLGTDDATVELAAQAAQALGLSYNAPEAALLTRRKDLARAQLKQAGLPVPAHRRVDLSRPLQPQIGGLVYPCVVKPLSLSGSRGVIRVDNASQLRAACERIRPLLRELYDSEARSYVLVEAFIPGPEVALEGMLDQGRLEVLAIFDKPDPLDGPFFEETYYITPSRLEVSLQARIARRVAEACRAYGLSQGPVHAELRVGDAEAWILEVAARTIGGQCARLLPFGTGHGLEDLVLAQAIGRPLAPERPQGAAGVLMIPIPRAGILRRVEGVLAAQRIPFIRDLEISIREGYELVPLPEGASYLGFIFSEAPTPEAAEQALRDAHACLNIVTAPGMKILGQPALAH